MKVTTHRHKKRGTETINGQTYGDITEPHRAALYMIRDAIQELFGPIASLESEIAELLRVPEPHHTAEAYISALQRVKARMPEPAKDGPEVVGWRQTDGDVVSAADMILPDKLDEPLVRLTDYEVLLAERNEAQNRHSSAVMGEIEATQRASAAEARNAELVKALDDLLDHVDRNTCLHEGVHRGGSIWTICDECGKKWADDRGGFVPYSDPDPVARARAVCGRSEIQKETDHD